ncbi:MAG: methyl-accepting chemotaxis protein [Planctomycetota bacterium]
MSIRSRLIAGYIICSVVPLIALSALSFWGSQRGVAQISAQAREDLERSVETRVVAARDIKMGQLNDCFDTIRDQVLTLSQSPSIVAAAVDFRTAFHELQSQWKVEGVDRGRMLREVALYYRNEFSAMYMASNQGRDAEAGRRLAELSPTEIMLQYAYIASNANVLGEKHLLDTAETGSDYDQVHAKHHPSIRSFLDKFGYDDIFLVDPDTGHIVYSVFKQLDYATSLEAGPYADTNVARAFRNAADATSPDFCSLVDFESYYPSCEAPASFIASPIFDGEKKVGVLVFRMPVDRIKELMSRSGGLGANGETLLIGSDGRLRCDSTLTPAEHDVRSKACDLANRGESGFILDTNFRGQASASAYAPVDVLGVRWAVVADLPQADASAAVGKLTDITTSVEKSMLWTGVFAMLAATVLIGGFSWLTANSIVRPIHETADTLRDIAEGEGDLTLRLDETAAGEIGQLAVNFNHFARKVHDIIASIAGNATTLTDASRELSLSAMNLSSGATQSKTQSATVSSAAEELSINMENMSRDTEEMSSSMVHVSQAIDEMKQTIAEVAENAEKSAEVAGEAAEAAATSNAKIGNMGNAANEIGRVIEVIQDIAEQTNLLALNATIEAARAGEAGKGFAVVATEVKELAKQTASATDDIRARIEAMQESTGEAVHSISEISAVIARVNELSSMIASAVEEQSITSGQIATHVNEATELSRTVAQSVAESASASREITENIGHVDGVLQETAEGADRSQASGDELSRLASEMQDLVSQFQIDSSQTTAVHS